MQLSSFFRGYGLVLCAFAGLCPELEAQTVGKFSLVDAAGAPSTAPAELTLVNTAWIYTPGSVYANAGQAFAYIRPADAVVFSGVLNYGGDTKWDNSNVLNQRLLNLGVTGEGPRFAWVPSKGSLRVGGLSVSGANLWEPTRLGAYSIAMGYDTYAPAMYSSAFGYATQATGSGAFTFGDRTLASGAYAFAAGSLTQATGARSVAFGDRTVAATPNSLALGVFNLSNPTNPVDATKLAVLTVGNGTTDTLRSNAFEVYTDGLARTAGHLYVGGQIRSTGDIYASGQIRSTGDIYASGRIYSTGDNFLNGSAGLRASSGGLNLQSLLYPETGYKRAALMSSLNWNNTTKQYDYTNLGDSAWSGISYKNGGSISFMTENLAGQSPMPTSRTDAQVNAAERMVITATGNVGIGTGAPTSKFHVQGDSQFAGNATITGNSTFTGNSIHPSASGYALGTDLAKWVYLTELLQGTGYLGNSERLEIEITGGAFDANGSTVYYIESRGGVEVTKLEINGGAQSQQLVIYDKLSATATGDEKYLVGLRLPLGWKSHTIRARELKSGKWYKLTEGVEPVADIANYAVVPSSIRYATYNAGDIKIVDGVLAVSSNGSQYNTDNGQWMRMGAGRPPSQGAFGTGIDNSRYGQLTQWGTDYAFVGLKNTGVTDRYDMTFGIEQNSDNYIFEVGGVTAATLTGAGRLALGKSTLPAEVLDVAGNAKISGNLTVDGQINNSGSMLSINSMMAVRGNDLRLGGNDPARNSSNTANPSYVNGGLALVSGANDTLNINFGGDFTGGVAMDGKLQVAGAIAATGNLSSGSQIVLSGNNPNEGGQISISAKTATNRRWEVDNNEGMFRVFSDSNSNNTAAPVKNVLVADATRTTLNGVVVLGQAQGDISMGEFGY